MHSDIMMKMILMKMILMMPHYVQSDGNDHNVDIDHVNIHKFYYDEIESRFQRRHVLEGHVRKMWVHIIEPPSQLESHDEVHMLQHSEGVPDRTRFSIGDIVTINVEVTKLGGVTGRVTSS